MTRGHLSEHFIGVGVKILRGTEVDPAVSRGHEFQGVRTFQVFLGTPTESQKIPVSYVWLSDDEAPLRLNLHGTWYDSRRGQSHRDPEPRLYYPAAAEDIVFRAQSGDMLFLCLPRQAPLLALLCKESSSICRQLLWLFDVRPTADFELSQRDLREETGRELNMAARYVLDLIEVEAIATEEDWLERLIRAFDGRFPATAVFSEFARKARTEVDPTSDPDHALLDWLDFEERLFMTFERHLINDRLARGFVRDGKVDADEFIQYSLSVQNRRKSRAGYSLGHHIAAILNLHGIKYRREAYTEKRSGPDFLFPGEVEYHDKAFPDILLSMLGAKTSCKERWRQILAEAHRIRQKHLITLEPGISETQTAEMEREQLQLVIPRGLHETYTESQQRWLMDLSSFIALIRSRQDEAKLYLSA